MSKQLIIAGDKIDSLIFSISGAKSFEIAHTDQLERVFKYCQENKRSIAGVMINKKFFDNQNKFFKKLESLDMPLVSLSSGFDDLLEKTLGRKLEN